MRMPTRRPVHLLPPVPARLRSPVQRHCTHPHHTRKTGTAVSVRQTRVPIKCAATTTAIEKVVVGTNDLRTVIHYMSFILQSTDSDMNSEPDLQYVVKILVVICE